ncbi:MAG: hypothetical protein ABR508_00470 [Candidatus Baltobacteraceae bacterium]
MELLGANFSIALGAWKLRFVLMLEEAPEQAAAPVHVHPGAPHHFTGRTTSRARAQ